MLCYIICRRTESKNGKGRPDNKEWALERCETLASIKFLKLHKNSIGMWGGSRWRISYLMVIQECECGHIYDD